MPLFDAVETMQSLGRNGFGDEEHLEFAASEGWTMFTFDTGDFARLHWQWIANGALSRRHHRRSQLTASCWRDAPAHDSTAG